MDWQKLRISYNKFLFSPAVFPLPALQPGKSYTITESGDGLNLRRSPALSGEVIKKLKEGDEIQVLEGPVEADENLWWRVRLEGSDDGGRGGRDTWLVQRGVVRILQLPGQPDQPDDRDNDDKELPGLRLQPGAAPNMQIDLNGKVSTASSDGLGSPTEAAHGGG